MAVTTTTEWRARVVAHLEAAEAAVNNQSADFVAKGEVARAHAWTAYAITAALEAKLL